jgi:hypothetical protein
LLEHFYLSIKHASRKYTIMKLAASMIIFT